ncbi:MAG: type IV pilin protein [Pirellulaceae bacterium]
MKNATGFTLIELMITIAILAILAGIAIPAYNNQVEKARRADAVTTLTSTAQGLERCFTRDNTYAGCVADSFESQDGFYDITVNSDATTYDLTATAKGAQSSDEDCKTFTLDRLGNKGATGDAPDRCWGS